MGTPKRKKRPSLIRNEVSEPNTDFKPSSILEHARFWQEYAKRIIKTVRHERYGTDVVEEPRPTKVIKPLDEIADKTGRLYAAAQWVIIHSSIVEYYHKQKSVGLDLQALLLSRSVHQLTIIENERSIAVDVERKKARKEAAIDVIR